MKIAKMYVHPSFKKKIKLKAVENETSMLNYTKTIANEDLEEIFKDGFKKKKKKQFTF